jgi:hypothetical protein
MCRGRILVLRVHFSISRFSQLVLSRSCSSQWGNLFPFDLLHCVSCLSEWSQIQSATATFLSHWIFAPVVILLRLCFKVRRLACVVLLGKFLVVRLVGVLVPKSGLPLSKSLVGPLLQLMLIYCLDSCPQDWSLRSVSVLSSLMPALPAR